MRRYFNQQLVNSHKILQKKKEDGQNLIVFSSQPSVVVMTWPKNKLDFEWHQSCSDYIT